MPPADHLGGEGWSTGSKRDVERTRLRRLALPDAKPCYFKSNVLHMSEIFKLMEALRYVLRATVATPRSAESLNLALRQDVMATVK
jgi:hypothetical protein